MASHTQISATISSSTRDKLDRFSESHGLKKNYIIEQALLYYLEARRDLPDEAFVPARLVLEDEAFEQLLTLLESPAAPTTALRELLRGPQR